MHSPSSISNSEGRKALKALALTALLVAVIEALLSVRCVDGDFLAAIRTHTTPKVSPDIQVMGDSVAHGGLFTDVAQSKLTGRSVINEALPGTGPEFTCWMLARQADANTLPKLIVYAPSPHTFVTDRTSLLVGSYLTWGEIARLGLWRERLNETVYGMMTKLSFSLRNREYIANRMKQGKAVETPSAGPKPNHAPGIPKCQEKDLNPMYKTPFTISTVNHRALDKFLEIAESHSIPVLWIKPPMPTAVLSARNTNGFFTAYDTFLAGMAARHMGLKFQPGAPQPMPDDWFQDQSHVNAEGALHWTQDLAPLLK